MKSGHQTGTIEKITEQVRNLINRISKQFSHQYEPIPQQYTHVTERFDAVRKLPYRGWIMGPDNK
jgi:hypothetical protein